MKAGTLKDICTPVLIEALFTIAKGGSNPSTNDQKTGGTNVVWPSNGILFNLKK